MHNKIPNEAPGVGSVETADTTVGFTVVTVASLVLSLCIINLLASAFSKKSLS